MISNKTIRQATDLIVKHCKPEKILLFGSYARGKINEDSDLDLLVVKQQVLKKRAETVEIRRLLSPLRIPVDVIVISKAQFESSWKDYPGTYLYDAVREGITLYEMA